MQGLYLLRDLLAAEVIATVNMALCEYHTAHCPAHEQMTLECAKVMGTFHSAISLVHKSHQAAGCMHGQQSYWQLPCKHADV